MVAMSQGDLCATFLLEPTPGSGESTMYSERSNAFKSIIRGELTVQCKDISCLSEVSALQSCS